MKTFPWYPLLAWLLIFAAVYAFFWAYTTPPARKANPYQMQPVQMPGASEPAASQPSAPTRPARPKLMV
jgi:hypothetical protein